MSKDQLQTNSGEFYHRRGIKPFAEGTFSKEEAKHYRHIVSPEVPFGSLGKLYIRLSRPKTDSDIALEAYEDEKGFTIDKDGNIREDNLRKMLQEGLYTIQIKIKPEGKPTVSSQELDMKLYIEGTEPIIAMELDQDIDPDGEFIATPIYLEKHEDHTIDKRFVINTDPDLLKKLSVSVETRKKGGESN